MRSRTLILVSLLLASYAVNLDTTIVNVALPSLVRELHASNSQLQWVVDAYNLVFAALLLAAGSLSDRLGRKGMLLAGLAVFGAASLAGSLMSTPGELIAARCVMGLGAAMVFPSTLSIISNVFVERRERARAIGLWGATAGIAIATGPIVGGWLLERFSWSSVFIAIVPVAALAAGCVAASVPSSRDELAGRLDVAGVALSCIAMALLIFTIIEAPNHGWSSARSLAGFALAAGLYGAFVAWERRVQEPMLDVTLFRNQRFTAASGAVTISFFALFGFIFLITQYFQFFKHYSPFSAGLHLLPVASCVGVGSVLGTRLAVSFGTKLTVGVGLLMTCGFYAWVAGSSASTSYGTIATQMVIFGTGIGFTSAPATEAIMGAVPRAKAGVGSAVNDSTRLLGGTLGVAIIGSVYASLYATRLGRALPARLHGATLHAARESAGAALSIAGAAAHAGHLSLGALIHSSASAAFFHGFSAANVLAACVAGAGAIMAFALLPSHPASQPSAQPGRDVHEDAMVPAPSPAALAVPD
jgi:EmrB/QacA subfamily drug resistance transporter